MNIFNGSSPASFSNKHYNFDNKNSEKLSIQFMVLGFEPTTFTIGVSSHNHKTKAPAESNEYF